MKSSKETIVLRKNNTVEALEEMLGLAKKNELDGFVMAGFINNGITISLVDVDVIRQHELLAHLFTNIITRFLIEEDKKQ